MADENPFSFDVCDFTAGSLSLGPCASCDRKEKVCFISLYLVQLCYSVYFMAMVLICSLKYSLFFLGFVKFFFFIS